MFTRVVARSRFVLLSIAISAPVIGYVALHGIHALTKSWVLSAAEKVEKKKLQDLPVAFSTIMDSVGILDAGVALQAVGVTLGAVAGAAAFIGFRAHESRPIQPLETTRGK